MKSLKYKFGKRVRELRKSRGITQEQIAELINIEPPNVSKMENGMHFPQPDKIEKIAKALNVEIYDLFDFEHHNDRIELLNKISIFIIAGLLISVTTVYANNNYATVEGKVKFSSKNLLDVYVGATLPFGVSKDKYINIFDGDNYGTQLRSSFEIGLGAYIGLQCFVADLPVAIGLEYGLTGYKFLGEKYKNITTDENGVEQVYYTTTPYNDYNQYSKLRSSYGYLGSDIRFTISYFFN